MRAAHPRGRGRQPPLKKLQRPLPLHPVAGGDHPDVLVPGFVDGYKIQHVMSIGPGDTCGLIRADLQVGAPRKSTPSVTGRTWSHPGI